MEIIISIRESLRGKDQSDEGAGSGAFSSNSLYSCCALGSEERPLGVSESRVGFLLVSRAWWGAYKKFGSIT
jgi:hypothetical protein